MRLGESARAWGKRVGTTIGGLALAATLAAGLAPAVVLAQNASAAAPAPVVSPAPTTAPGANPITTPRVAATSAAAPATLAPQADSAEPSTAKAAPGAGGGSYVPMKPTPGKGMPEDGRLTFQDQYSPIGDYAMWMHDAILLPIITVISLFVLALLLWVVVRYRRAANPVPSKTTHNAVIEVVWTLLPVLILVGIAVPSISLLAKQYKPAPAKALTVKATGYQWYWGYTYPDNGGFEVISNMLPEEEALKRGEPGQLAADNRMVVPAGEPIRLQTTAADVIHAFAIPSLWYKLDAVPGRINEKVLFIKEPGVYYGQCSELCGARHGYMPIAIEALPRPAFEAWVLAQGGTIAAPADANGAPPAAAPAQEPESSVPGAPGAGPAPAAAAGAEPAPATKTGAAAAKPPAAPAA